MEQPQILLDLAKEMRGLKRKYKRCKHALTALELLNTSDALTEEAVGEVWKKNKLQNFFPLEPEEVEVKAPKKRKPTKTRRGKTTGYNLFARQLRKDNPDMDFRAHGREAGASWRDLTDEEKELWKQKAVGANANEDKHTCEWVLTRGKSKGDLCGRDATHLPSGLTRCRTHISSKVRGGSGSESDSDAGAEVAPWHDVNIPVVVLAEVAKPGECERILKKGPRKGKVCRKPSKEGDLCKAHAGK